MNRPAALAVAIPGCLLAAASLVALMLAAFGEYPMWPHKEVNLAEAAAVREEAEVTRLIEQGQNPNIRYTVRPGLLFERSASLTPLEAAVLNNDPAMVAHVLALSVSLDSATWVALRCFAADSPVAPVLDAHRPAGTVLDCRSAKVSWN